MKGRTAAVTNVLLPALHLASLVPAHEQRGDEEAASRPTEPLVPSRPRGETGLTGAVQKAKIPTGKVKFMI